MLAEQLEAGSCAPCEMSMSIVHVSHEDDADLVPSPPADQAAYDAWLAAKVQEALDDDAPTMSTEEVMQYVRIGAFSDCKGEHADRALDAACRKRPKKDQQADRCPQRGQRRPITALDNGESG